MPFEKKGENMKHISDEYMKQSSNGKLREISVYQKGRSDFVCDVKGSDGILVAGWEGLEKYTDARDKGISFCLTN